MPKSIIDLIGELAEKAGVSKDDEKLKSFMTNSALASVTVDDSVVTAINQKLIPIDAAKSNSEIANHFKASIYNGVDARLEKVLDELDLDETEKAQIKTALTSEKSTPEKAAILAKKIKELEKAKASAGLKGDKKEYQDKIDQLQAQLADLTAKGKTALEEKEKEIANLNLSYLLDGELLGYNFAFPEGMPLQVKLQTVKGLLNHELQKQGATLVNDNGVLVLKKLDGSAFYNNAHQKVDTKQFIDGVLAQNNMLAASKKEVNGKQNGTDRIIAGADSHVDASRYKSKAEQRIKEFEQGSQVVNADE